VDATPVISGSALFIPSTDGKIYETSVACRGANFGNVCRPKVFIDLGTPIESSPVVVSGVLYVGADNDRLYAINSATGSVLWTVATAGKVVSSPAVASGLVVFGSEDGNVYGVDAATGLVKFTITTGGPVTSSPAVDIGSKTIFVGSQDGHLYAIPLSCAGACAPKWRSATNGPIESSPALSNGTVFIGSDDGDLYALSESTGQAAWSVVTGGAVKSPPSVANGVLYFGSDNGRVYAVASTGCGQTQCPPLWSAVTGGAVVAEPVVADGSLFVGSGDGLLHVYQLPKAG
jgi:outer membrane protein assembly factor BamB